MTAPVVDTAIAKDDFTRTAGNGWGTADKGGAWTATGTAANFAVADGKGKIVLPTAGLTRSQSLPALAATSADTTVSVSLDKPAAPSTYVSVIGRRIDANNDYRAKLRFYDNGDVNVSLVRKVAGTETTITGIKVPGVTYTAGDTLKVRLQVTGTSPAQVKAKIWRATDAEPAGWTTSTTDATAALQVNGGLGVQVYLPASARTRPSRPPSTTSSRIRSTEAGDGSDVVRAARPATSDSPRTSA